MVTTECSGWPISIRLFSERVAVGQACTQAPQLTHSDARKSSFMPGETFDDMLVGTEQDDAINALAGDDALYGLGGDDVLDGGAGDDYVDAGACNDLGYHLADQGRNLDEAERLVRRGAPGVRREDLDLRRVEQLVKQRIAQAKGFAL